MLPAGRATGTCYHEIRGFRGMREHLSKMETCFSTIDRESSTARTARRAIRADILAAFRRLDSLVWAAETQ
jgi:hypothetical protein